MVGPGVPERNRKRDLQRKQGQARERSTTAVEAFRLRSGASVQEVNQLLRQYAQMRKMFKSRGKSSFARRIARMKMPRM